MGTLTDLLRRRHRSLETRIATLEVDARARRARVVQLSEELVAHATVEQLVVYPYAQELLGLRDLSLEIERALDVLLDVVGGMDREIDFLAGLARLSSAFERHVACDETGLLPMIESLGEPGRLALIEQRIQEFERSLAVARTDGPGFWPETAGDLVARVGGRN